MKKLVICVTILISIISCQPNSPDYQEQQQSPAVASSHTEEITTDNTITVFLTGNLLGSLKPCGCSGGQLGGLNRRPAIFNTVPDDKRLIIDTGNIVEKQADQDAIKFSIIMEAYKYLKYDIINLSKQDIEMAPPDPALHFISAYGFDRDIVTGNQFDFTINEDNIKITVITFDPEVFDIEDIGEVFPENPGQKNINILILNSDDNDIINEIAKIGIVDCLICQIPSDEPMTIDNSDSKTLICSVGRQGKYISKLDIQNITDGNVKLNFSYVAVREEIKEDTFLIELYKIYQDLVKQAGLLEDHSKYSLPDDLYYIGSKACYGADCHGADKDFHQYEYIVWSEPQQESGEQHSHAYQTLVDVGSQYDPECIVCHVCNFNI